MEAESRKRGRELETTESSELDSQAKKLDVEKGDADGCCGGREGEEEGEETGRGVFDFPWLKGGGEGGGVMTEEEWKAAAAAEEEDSFLGSLGRCCKREELEMEQGMTFLEDTSSTTSLSLVDLEDGVSLEAWDRDGIWTSLLH